MSQIESRGPGLCSPALTRHWIRAARGRSYYLGQGGYFGRSQPWIELRCESSEGSTGEGWPWSRRADLGSSPQHPLTVNLFHHSNAPASNKKFTTYGSSFCGILINFFPLKKLTGGSLVRWTTALLQLVSWPLTLPSVACSRFPSPSDNPYWLLIDQRRWGRARPRSDPHLFFFFFYKAGKIASRIYCKSCYKFILSHHCHLWMLGRRPREQFPVSSPYIEKVLARLCNPHMQALCN